MGADSTTKEGRPQHSKTTWNQEALDFERKESKNAYILRQRRQPRRPAFVQLFCDCASPDHVAENGRCAWVRPGELEEARKGKRYPVKG